MSNRSVALAATAVSALLPASLLAQTLDRQGAENPESGAIVVTANRTSRPIAQVGESVTVIGEEEIVNRQASELLDLLRTVPGVTITRNGGLGTTAGVSIRGAQSDQTMVLIDGIKLNDPAAPGGGFDFGPLLVGNIARVEVVRGSQSVLYGSQAIGGVVNLITRAPTDDPAMFARAEYGGRDTAELVGNVSGRLGAVSASVGATYLRTDGISVFSQARGGTEADGFESFGLNGKLGVVLSDTLSLDLRGFFADSEAGVDGFPPPLFAFADTNQISRRRDLVGYAGINAALLDGRFRNRLGFAYTDIERSNLDLVAGGENETFAATGRNRRFEYQGVFEAGSRAEVVLGAEREESEYRTSSFGGPAALAEVWVNSAYTQANLTPLTGLSLTGGIRFDDHETFGGQTTVSASGAYSPNDGATVVRGSYGEGFKAPALFQLFSDFGNSALLPEESTSWDIGVTQELLAGRAQFGVTYFERNGTNEIVFVGCFENPLPPCRVANPPFGTYDNIARASASGWEFGLAWQVVPGFDASLNYSIIDAFDDTTGKRLPRRADETLSFVADYRLANGLGLGATVLMVGDSFDNPANSQKLAAYMVADLRVSYGITNRIEVFGRLENVTDEEYETVLLYGQPGRAVFGGLRYRM